MKAVNNTIRVSENGSYSRCFRNECFIYSVELMDATRSTLTIHTHLKITSEYGNAWPIV